MGLGLLGERNVLRIIIATSDEGSRNLISRLVSQTPNARVVATVKSEEPLVRAVTYRRPNLAFVSTDFGEKPGYKSAETLVRRCPNLYVAMLSPRGNNADEILRAMKIGARECLAEPLAEDAVLRVLQDALHRDDPAAERRGTIIPVLSSRGGVGKSTIAVNLAIALRRRYTARVALVDGDLHFGDVSVMLNIKPERTIHELNRALDPEIATRFLHKHSSGIDVLPAPQRRVEVASISPDRFREILRVLQNLYDLIIVDGATIDVMPCTLDVANLAIVVSTLDPVCLQDVHHMITMLDRLSVPFDDLVPVGNRFDDRLSFSREEAERLLGTRFAAILPRDDRNVLAGNRGIPLILSDPDVPFVRKIISLATMVLEQNGTVHRAVV
jgi:pilus assembly protein CpaE